MSKRKPKKRSYRTITFKVFYDTDPDILDWWEGIESGQRSDAMREVIREQLGIQGQTRRGEIIELPELVAVRQDTLWIKDALNDMPAYLERIIQHVAANVQPVAVGQYQPRASPVEAQTDDPALTDAETQRRTRRMKRATW